ncbi:hypothetical protein P9D43_15120 [Neobacillus niacini]|uniref:hypothetical protein n=1 Tax=Neobacillus niacini TaxID=86668 RepID=UPI0007ABA829|nr:hypothetical protein [Neobacillus niacini]MEC1523335.1 hypothetical protein [Neobacillus niacini]
MKKNEKYYNLENKIRSLPEPDYDKNFTKETQDIIHKNLIQFASSYDTKKKRTVMIKKISAGLASIVAIVLFAILTIPLLSLNSNQQGQQGKGEPVVDKNKDKEDIDQNPPKENLYNNSEYGFSFTLPETWVGFQIVTDSWEGIDTDQQQVENGQILLIRHPAWSEEQPRQDIPIMIFTLKQWSSLEKGEFHIGAAPIGPTLLGLNDEYVFALPARYNFAFLEGYEEVENILENNPLEPKNVIK